MTCSASVPSGLAFDPDALRAKYRGERDRRLRADGNAQYVELKGGFARYLDDPHVAPGFSREKIAADMDVPVVGGGFSGLLASARLRERGVDELLIVEKAGDFGGTWYWNRYPGAACDTEAYIYMPNEATARNGAYLKGPNTFGRLLEAWRAEDAFRGLEATR